MSPIGWNEHKAKAQGIDVGWIILDIYIMVTGAWTAEIEMVFS